MTCWKRCHIQTLICLPLLLIGVATESLAQINVAMKPGVLPARTTTDHSLRPYDVARIPHGSILDLDAQRGGFLAACRPLGDRRLEVIHLLGNPPNALKVGVELAGKSPTAVAPNEFVAVLGDSSLLFWAFQLQACGCYSQSKEMLAYWARVEDIRDLATVDRIDWFIEHQTSSDPFVLTDAFIALSQVSVDELRKHQGSKQISRWAYEVYTGKRQVPRPLETLIESNCGALALLMAADSSSKYSREIENWLWGPDKPYFGRNFVDLLGFEAAYLLGHPDQLDRIVNSYRGSESTFSLPLRGLPDNLNVLSLLKLMWRKRSFGMDKETVDLAICKLLTNDEFSGYEDIIIDVLREQSAWHQKASVLQQLDKSFRNNPVNRSIARFLVAWLWTSPQAEPLEQQEALEILRSLKNRSSSTLDFIDHAEEVLSKGR